MVRKFPFLTEGSIEAILRLCMKNGGLVLPPVKDPDFLLAYYRYWPRLAEAVEKQDFGTLEREDLRGGTCLYIAAFITPACGYSIVREVVRTLNPFLVTCHRWNERTEDFRFACQRNRYFNKERWRQDHG